MKKQIIKKINRISGIEKVIIKKQLLSLAVLTAGVIFFWVFLVGMLPSSDKAEAANQTFMDITVKEMAGLDIQRSVTGGIPLSEGAAPKGSRFVLLDKDSKPIPCQAEVLATWNDGSARWVLLDFQANPRVNTTDKFRLIWDPKAREAQPSRPVRASQGNVVSVNSGNVQLRTVPGSLLRISNRFDVKLVLTDRQGKRCEAVVESSKVETSGKMRSTLALSGAFRTPEGKPGM